MITKIAADPASTASTGWFANGWYNMPLPLSVGKK
jgi:hypothetical protein